MRVMNAAAEVNVSPKIGVDWYNFFCDICAEHFLTNPIAIVSPGKVVEINESKFGEYLHRKITMFVSIHVCACGWALGVWRDRAGYREIYKYYHISKRALKPLEVTVNNIHKNPFHYTH